MGINSPNRPSRLGIIQARNLESPKAQPHLAYGSHGGQGKTSQRMGRTSREKRTCKLRYREKMTLLTKKIREDLPKLYDNEGKSDAKVIVKFFTPDSNWTWYATEFDGVDTFFGLVDGFEQEFGYFSLRELEEIRGPLGLLVERDIHFEPKPLSEVREGIAVLN